MRGILDTDCASGEAIEERLAPSPSEKNSQSFPFGNCWVEEHKGSQCGLGKSDEWRESPPEQGNTGEMKPSQWVKISLVLCSCCVRRCFTHLQKMVCRDGSISMPRFQQRSHLYLQLLLHGQVSCLRNQTLLNACMR